MLVYGYYRFVIKRYKFTAAKVSKMQDRDNNRIPAQEAICGLIFLGKIFILYLFTQFMASRGSIDNGQLPPNIANNLQPSSMNENDSEELLALTKNADIVRSVTLTQLIRFFDLIYSRLDHGKVATADSTPQNRR